MVKVLAKLLPWFDLEVNVHTLSVRKNMETHTHEGSQRGHK